MRLLSDSIETFIKELMEGEDNCDERAEIELRRNELAAHFGCAPSQINYVLATRFTPDHGYVTESRRGGGGYIRIVRIASGGRQEMLRSILSRIGTSLSLQDASHIIEHLRLKEVIDEGEASLMLAAIAPSALPLPLDMKEMICAATLRSMILSLARRKN